MFIRKILLNADFKNWEGSQVNKSLFPEIVEISDIINVVVEEGKVWIIYWSFI